MIVDQTERALDVWAGVLILNNARIHESVLCLAVHHLSRQELNLVAGDAQIIASVDEALDAEDGYAAVVVYASGLELALELLQIGVLDDSATIHWHLDLDLPDTLEVLDSMSGAQLSRGMKVVGINHARSGTVVTTGLAEKVRSGLAHAGADADSGTSPGTDKWDANSFRHGVQAASIPRHQQTDLGLPTAQERERLLLQKLLHTLQVVEPLIDPTPSGAKTHDVAAEKQLILLKRKYDALERRYNSLAASQLGKLTLRLWARKSVNRHGRVTAARAR